MFKFDLNKFKKPDIKDNSNQSYDSFGNPHNMNYNSNIIKEQQI
jgi:hypothetical protein